MILEEIAAVKREEVALLKGAVNLKELRQRALDAPPVRDFQAAVRGEAGQVKLIAEIKKASPTRGVLRQDFDPVAIARDYAMAGASAISVLTDERFFQGHPLDLSRVREVVDLPVLRKEFIIDPVQLYQSRLLGADAVLLIAAILDQCRLEECLELCRELGLAALVEVHTSDELFRVLETGAGLIGINNRDLHTFETNLETTLELLPLIPGERLVVSESGIRSHDDLARLGEAGVAAVLVGETLMRSWDIASGVRELLGVTDRG